MELRARTRPKGRQADVKRDRQRKEEVQKG